VVTGERTRRRKSGEAMRELGRAENPREGGETEEECSANLVSYLGCANDGGGRRSAAARGGSSGDDAAREEAVRI
jgi:hypothetical protein